MSDLNESVHFCIKSNMIHSCLSVRHTVYPMCNWGCVSCDMLTQYQSHHCYFRFLASALLRAVKL